MCLYNLQGRTTIVSRPPGAISYKCIVKRSVHSYLNWTLPLFIPRQHYHIFSFKVLTLPNLGGLFVKESPAAGGSCRSLLGGLQRHRPIHRRFHERAYRHLMWRHKASLDDVIARHRSCTERCKYPRLCDGSILLNDVREEYRILTGTINYFMIIINLLECRIVFILS